MRASLTARAVTDGVRLLAAGAACAIVAWSGSRVSASELVLVFTDDQVDAEARRTDPGNDGPLAGGSMLPDLLEVRLCGWEPADASDPYTGVPVADVDARLFRLDVVLDGLVNPPGPIGLNGALYDPFRYGPSPVFGFVELDVDADVDTGGELDGAARSRYLANASRFGGMPTLNTLRAAEHGSLLDFDFYTSPQFERSGQDFSLTLCGCSEPVVVSESGDGDGVFDAGESWVMRSRYFRRASGYRQASGVFGGSVPGLYDPLVELLFTHDVSADRTTVSLVYPLTMEGASVLEGGSVQQPDTLIDILGSHDSMEEALLDVIYGVSQPMADGPARILSLGWLGRSPGDYLRPLSWRTNALVGTSYLLPEDALYVWTDVGFDATTGDVNGDSLIDFADWNLIRTTILLGDGTPDDADGVVNGEILIPNFGVGFCVHDLDGDGIVGQADFGIVDSMICRADLSGDGLLSVGDILDFLNAWTLREEIADFNADGRFGVGDILDFLSAWAEGC